MMVQSTSILLLLAAFLTIPLLVTANVDDSRLGGGSGAAELDDATALKESSSASSARRHLLSCPEPEKFYYRAEFQLRLAYAPRKMCSSAETAFFGSRIDYHFDQYSFYTAKLGPVYVVRSAPSCPTNDRRRLVGGTNETSSAFSEPPVSLTVNTTDMATRELTDGTDQNQRKLWYSGYYPWWVGIGPCRYCNPDNRDGGRRRLDGITPISLTVGTDRYPSEMSLEIQKLDGTVVFEHSHFGYAQARKLLKVYVTAGQTYKLVMKDTYGDGWCCGYGGGEVYVYEGLTGSGTPFAQFGTVFGKVSEQQFTVPISPTGRSAFIGGEDSEASFMELGGAVSDYVSYYMQQEFQHDRNSCLYRTYPEVMVSLTPATETTSLVCM